MMSVSTKQGDSGYTSTLSGDRVPKYHLVTEAAGSIDEANAMLGLARSETRQRSSKRILLQVQKHLFTIGAELSMADGGRPLRKTVTDADILWLERLIEGYEEALALPPGFIAFGQETCSAQLDVARTAVRKAERIVVKMKSEGLVGNPLVLKYLNRLSDLIFVLACAEERTEREKSMINRAIFRTYWADPAVRKLSGVGIAVVAGLLAAIILILVFHRPAPELQNTSIRGHMQEMVMPQK